LIKANCDSHGLLAEGDGGQAWRDTQNFLAPGVDDVNAKLEILEKIVNFVNRHLERKKRQKDKLSRKEKRNREGGIQRSKERQRKTQRKY
jgi:hypothetical protein